MVMGLMMYTCRESLFKAVLVSQRTKFESSTLSLLREKWVSVASCLPKMFCDCLRLQRLKSRLLHITKFASWLYLCSVYNLVLRFILNCMVLVGFLFSYSTQTAALAATDTVPPVCSYILYPAYKYLCSLSSFCLISSHPFSS